MGAWGRARHFMRQDEGWFDLPGRMWVRGGSQGAWRARGIFQGSTMGKGMQGRGNSMLGSLWTGLSWRLGSGGGSIQDTKGCLFRVPFNSHDLDSSLEMTGTIHRTLICLALEFIVLEEFMESHLVAGGAGDSA